MVNNETQKKNYIIIWTLLALVIGLTSGWFIRVYYNSKQPSKLVEIRTDDSSYHFINPLLLVDSQRQAPEFDSLKQKISNFISDSKNKDNANSISVYFRELNSGRWTGVDEDTKYAPSSMLKVAVMMGYIEKAESDPGILLKKFDYTASVDPGQNYKPEHPLASGLYTTKDLIEAMIVDSDNTALDVLYKNDNSALINPLKILNIPAPKTKDELDFMSPKSYSDLFRTLYSSTFLPRNISEQVLQLLASTNFKKGLNSGVTEGTIIAHKFGEHTTTDSLGVVQFRELHDCGIVYINNPYFICIMTKGQNFSNLESIISGISKITFDYMNLKSN